MNVDDYEDPKVWRKGIEAVDKIRVITDSFPRGELYGVGAQVLKACTKEGIGRIGRRDES